MANEPAPQKPPHKYRWITNNGEGVIGFTLALKSDVSGQTSHDPALSLSPGANLVEIKRWEALKAADKTAAERAAAKNLEPTAGEIARLLAEKIPRGTHKNRQPENPGKPYLVEGPTVAAKNAPLDGLSDEQALSIVDDLKDLPMATALHGIEKRPAVSVALSRAIEVLTKGASKIAAA